MSATSRERVVDTRQHQELVHPYLLERWATETPDRLFVRFPEHEDEQWTYRKADALVNQTAHHLVGAGVEKGDVVALFHEAGPQYLRFFLGTLRRGGTVAPVNEAFRGESLRYALDLSGARVLVCDAGHLDRIRSLELAHLRTLFVTGDPEADLLEALEGRYEVILVDGLPAAPLEAPPAQPIHFWDPYAIVLTSGTTGRSKASLSPYGQIHAVVKDNYDWLTGDDVYLVDLPMFHISGLVALFATLRVGGTMVIYPKFSASRYWDRIRTCGATTTMLMQIMMEILWKQPRRPDDADNPLRCIMTGAMPYVSEWVERFGVDMWFNYYNMTETCSPLIAGVNPVNERSCGRVREGVECRIVDENDIDVPLGKSGELVLRTDLPWEMTSGYLSNPEATAAAWRNGWFHTGDLFFQDEEGSYYLVDRIKDSVRRRGENISSFEVEQEILAHPDVAECAVVAAPGETAADEEVRAVIVLADTNALAPDALVDFLEPRLPAFMLPRYVDVVDTLPRNSSMRVLKHVLREEGINTSTWDRMAQP